MADGRELVDGARRLVPELKRVHIVQGKVERLLYYRVAGKTDNKTNSNLQSLALVLWP